MDPETLQGVLDAVFGDLTAETEAGGGHVERIIGDAVLATFGSRTAHENDPLRAVDVACRMRERLQARSAETSLPLRLRIGINSGVVVLAPVAGVKQIELYGDAVNVAARLQQMAGPDEILVAAPIWRRVRDRYEGAPVGRLELKGRVQRVEAYRILGRRPTGARKLTPFVGRRDELALLELLWSNTLKDNTHVISLVGEAGVGKSRLLEEFGPRGEGRDVRVVCRSDQAFWPVVEMIHLMLGVRPRTPEELLAACENLPGIDEEIVALLGALLGLSGAPPAVALADEHQKRQMFAGLWLFLLAAAGEGPLLIVFDDVHWADRSSLDLIGFLLERLGSAPIMLVLAYRPGFEHVTRTAIRASHTGIRLEMLSAEESVTLARGFLSASKLPDDLERLVAQRAEGNPFFIEELLQALIELGSLAVRGDDVILGKVNVDIPDTVEGTILSRLDRLQPRTRAVLHHASVIGRTFSTDLLRAITGEEGLDQILEELSRAQLIVAQGPGQWAFKHALIQEVIYSTLLLRQRKELHRVVAEALEQLEPASLELLAEHYAKAEIRDRARVYAVEAGDAASERMGFVEARGRYETALRLWGEGDEEGRLSVVMKLAAAQAVSADAGAAVTSLIEAEAGWRALGNFIRAGEALAILGRVHFWIGDSEHADEYFRRAIELLDSLPPSPELVKALTWASALETLTGRVDRLADLASRGLSMDPGVVSDGARASLLTSLGRADVERGDPRGVDKIRQALELAQRWGEAEPLGRAYINLVLCLSELHEPDALDTCRRGRDVVRRLGALSFEVSIAGVEARVLTALGLYHEAKVLAGEILDARSTGMVAPGLLFAGQAMVDALLRQGSYEEARRRLDYLLPLARRMGGAAFLVPAFTSEAELEAARGNRVSARLAIAAGLDVAMKSLSLIHDFECLVPAARILGGDAKPLLDRLSGAATHPWFEAQRLEAEGHLSSDASQFHQAAELYEGLELPYEECRARIEASEDGRAAEIAERFGLKQGPLGPRLQRP